MTPPATTATAASLPQRAGLHSIVTDLSSDQRAFKNVPWGKAMMGCSSGGAQGVHAYKDLGPAYVRVDYCLPHSPPPGLSAPASNPVSRLSPGASAARIIPDATKFASTR